jgi:hypothetical protein
VLHASMTEAQLCHLTAEQIRARPHPAVNPIAWALWHAARCEDFGVNRLLADRPQVLDDEEWMRRLGAHRRDVGREMTPAEVDELADRLNPDALRSYWDAVGRRTVEVVTALSPAALDEIADVALVRRVVFDEGTFQGDQREEVVRILTGRSRSDTLAYLGLTHLWDHFGEIGVIRGLWQHRGHS